MSANQPFAVMRAATAIHCVASSLHQHQKLTHTERGDSWGLCAPIPAVVDDNTRDRSSLLPARAGLLSVSAHLPVGLGAGFGRRPFSHSHRVAVPSLTQSRKQAVGSSRLIACAYSRCAGSRRARDLSAIGSGSRPAIGNTLADQQSVNAFADLPHLSSLSSSLVSVGIDPNERRLTYAKRSFAPGAKAND